MVGAGWHFSLRSLQELLVAAIDELRNLAADHVSRVSEDLCAAIVGFLDGRRAVVLLQEDASLRAWSFDQIEAVLSKPADNVFVGFLFYFCGHFINSIPVIQFRCGMHRFDGTETFDRESNPMTLKTETTVNDSIDIPF